MKMKEKIQRWIIRRIWNKHERDLLNGIVGTAYFLHKRCERERGYGRWTPEGEQMVLRIERLIR